MTLYVSPKHSDGDFAGGMTLNDKIEVFIARVEGWQFGVARAMIDKDIPDREFALLHIVMNYFEMIAKYHKGYTGSNQSKEFFRKGVRIVFPEISNWPSGVYQGFINALYGNVRCGLYHIGIPYRNVIVTNVDAIAPIRYYPESRRIILNPDKLIEALQSYFAVYVAELRDPANIAARTNFEVRFNLDNNC